MDSNKVFEEIFDRKSQMITWGKMRNAEYSEYLQASASYDNLKKAFYLAINLSKLEQTVPEGQLQRYEYLVKHFDQQILHQLKEEDYKVITDDIEINDTEKNDFQKRISKINEQGVLRNKSYFKYVESERKLRQATDFFYNKNALASRDGLITEIEEKIHTEYMKTIQQNLDEEMKQIRQSHNVERKRGHCDNGDARRDRGHEGYGRGRKGRGRGGNGSRRDNRGRDGRGRGSRGRTYHKA